MSAEEEAVWALHFERFQRALADGMLNLVGPTLGRKNTGIAIFEAPVAARPRLIPVRPRPPPAVQPLP